MPEIFYFCFRKSEQSLSLFTPIGLIMLYPLTRHQCLLYVTLSTKATTRENQMDPLLYIAGKLNDRDNKRVVFFRLAQAI